MMTCACCRREIKPRDPDPWEGRMDDYCETCCVLRCDAHPGEHRTARVGR